MKQKKLVTVYEKNISEKKEFEAIEKDLTQGIASEKKTIDRLLKSIQYKTNQLSFKKSQIKECDRFIITNKSSYMYAKSYVTKLDRLLNAKDKLEDEIEKKENVG